MITLSKLLVVLAFTLAVHVVLVSSLIISPSLHKNTNANVNANANININININTNTKSSGNGNGNGRTIANLRTRTNGISIRSTKPKDLPTIVDLLAFETSGPNGSSPKTFNWKTKMQRLKNIQSLKTQLSNRLSVVNAARELMHPQSPLMKKYIDDTNVDIDVSAHAHQILWSDDSFRNKCEKAIKTTLEYNTYSTLWNNHNFALTPDERLMQHYMITAIDDTFVGYDDDDGDGDGDVVGFCEVGILSNPDVEGELMYCIGNLVVSPNHRQRGIGSKLIKNALRTMRMHGKAQLLGLENVGLYVDGQNENAIGLYEKIGFQVTGKCNHVNDRLFMQMNLLDTDVVASDAVHAEVEDVHAQKYICVESGYGYGSELDHQGREAFAFS